MNKIEIKCKAAEFVSIDKFTEIQGTLKELSVKNYEKLKNSILKYGFSFPVFCWKQKNTYWILDAHQRLKTLKKLAEEENYFIPPLPVVFVECDNKRQAKEKLLMLNSNYGKITDEGLYEYLNEIGNEIDFDSIKLDLELPGIDLDMFEQGFLKETDSEVLDDVPEIPKNPLSKVGDIFLPYL